VISADKINNVFRNTYQENNMGDVIDFNAHKNVSSINIEQPVLQITPFKNILSDMKIGAVTPSAIDALESKHDKLAEAYVRHMFHSFDSGDFGKICEEDLASNEMSIKDKTMVMGVYPLDPREPKGDDVWIIMDGGHETVTLLLPEDY